MARARMIFSQIQQAPGPDSRKVGKSLYFDTIMIRLIWLHNDITSRKKLKHIISLHFQDYCED